MREKYIERERKKEIKSGGRGSDILKDTRRKKDGQIVTERSKERDIKGNERDREKEMEDSMLIWYGADLL